MNRKIISTAKKIRKQVQKWVVGNDGCDPVDLWGACALSSYTFYRALRILGYKSDLICAVTGSEGHCWVELENKTIDLTATQFDNSLPDVYIIDSKDYREQEIPRFFKYSRDEYNSKVFCGFLTNISALREIKRWGDQNPLQYRQNINNFLKTI